MNTRFCTPTAKIEFSPGEQFALHNRLWQGCPTVESVRDGILYAGWYTGGTREPSLLNYNVLYRSRDNGFSFPEKPLLVIAGTPAANKLAIDIQLWNDPAGKLWVFWVERDCLVKARAPGHLALFAITSEDPAAENPHWSPVRYIGDGFLRCKPIVLADGRWFLPAYDFKNDHYCWSVSADQGKTFTRQQGPKKLATAFEETMFCQVRQNSAIRLFARCSGGFIGQSISTDGGKSWSETASGGIKAPDSRLFITRLKNDRLLLISNDHDQKRTNLTARLSDDGGNTWKWSLLLDDADNVSYPDATELPDGSIVAIYDHGRSSFKEILTARFTQQDIENGRLLESPDSTSFLRHIISKAPAAADREAYEKLRKETEQWVKDLLAFWM